MRKLSLLLIVLFTNILVSKAQSTNPPAFDDDVMDQMILPSGNNNLSVYPNPSTGNFNIALRSFAGQKVAITITNSNGKLISYRQVSNCKDCETVNFNMAGLTKGMYVIRIVGTETTRTSKLFISA